MSLRCASFNVLADAYLDYGSYEHVTPSLLLPETRIPHLIRLITGLRADIVCLQEVEQPLVDALAATGKWQLFWTPKEGGEPDGCLTLVRHGIAVNDCRNLAYSDGSNHVAQSVVVEGVRFVNTHLKYPPRPAGLGQAKELLDWVGTDLPAVIFADGNDRPGGPVRALLKTAGFTNMCGHQPTALIGEERAALDLIAVRGVRAKRITTSFRPDGIPTASCPSDHIPVMASIEVS